MVDIGLVAVGLAIALLIVFVSMMTTAINKSGGSADRREFLKGIVALGTGGYIVGTVGERAMQELASEANICRIPSGNVLWVFGGKTEECGTVIWEESGTLRMDTDATLEVTG